MPEDESVPGQEKKTDPKLCGDCVSWETHCQCSNKESDRCGGVVDEKAAACDLFKHV